jgi:hypothetical protein
MKNASITTINELPDWFKLENYAKAAKFEDASDSWHYELSTRLKLRETLRVNKNLEPQNNWRLLRSWVKIKNYGLLNCAEDDEMDIKIREMLMINQDSISKTQSTLDIDEPVCATIQTLSNFSAYGFLWFDSMKNEIDNKFHVNFIEEFSKTDSIVKKEAFAWLWQPYHGSSFLCETGHTYAQVNMQASDEQIKKDFAKWLAHQRQRRNKATAKKNFSESDFSSWSEAAILPYLDLIFWAELESIRIPQHVIAQAIFPNAYALGSDVDPLGKLKTTKKKIEALMNEDAMTVLALQISD